MKIIKFLIYLLPWFISSLFVDNNFYQNLILPFFAPNKYIFIIMWTIIYFLLAISIYKIYDQYNFKKIKSYNYSLILNYISNILFVISFFNFKNIFLGFIFTLIILITTLNLYNETRNLNKKYSKLLFIYIIWDLFAVILNLIIYLLNF